MSVVHAIELPFADANEHYPPPGEASRSLDWAVAVKNEAAILAQTPYGKWTPIVPWLLDLLIIANGAGVVVIISLWAPSHFGLIEILTFLSGMVLGLIASIQASIQAEVIVDSASRIQGMRAEAVAALLQESENYSMCFKPMRGSLKTLKGAGVGSLVLFVSGFVMQIVVQLPHNL
jgi:hypothetical protein